ncbi:hypothetical protein E2C01_090231 [Portunus trituberculatus]|uniref:Uncharacterized protein n=1 Tax=Portunus trituberculatus TaxID=210409 RepID=A0A5B7JPJ8_PORTR|nr:hypothetical protein [Portunus trituberculatus]
MRFLPTSAWAIPYSVLICIAILTPSALGVGLLLRPSNISCFNAHASTLTILHYTPCPSQHWTCPPTWWPQAFTPPGNLLS